MSDTTIFRINVRRDAVRAFVEQVERWQIDHAEAMAARDLEDWISDVVRMADDCRRLTRTLYGRLGVNQLPEPFLVRDALKALNDLVGVLCGVLASQADWLVRCGYVVDGLAGLRESAAKTAALSAWMTHSWPAADDVFDPDEMRESIEQADRGELIPHDEVWRRLGESR